jgi:hypothetical protein
LLPLNKDDLTLRAVDFITTSSIIAV